MDGAESVITGEIGGIEHICRSGMKISAEGKIRITGCRQAVQRERLVAVIIQIQMPVVKRNIRRSAVRLRKIAVVPVVAAHGHNGVVDRYRGGVVDGVGKEDAPAAGSYAVARDNEGILSVIIYVCSGAVDFATVNLVKKPYLPASGNIKSQG